MGLKRRPLIIETEYSPEMKQGVKLKQDPHSIENTLQDRGKKYGDFNEHARITQNIKAAYRDSPNWKILPSNMKESLEMIAHKMGRILNGDPYHYDSWHDIEGYIRLVSQELEKKWLK